MDPIDQDDRPTDLLAGVKRFQPYPLAHWCEDAAEMREDPEGEWVWFEEAHDLFQGAVFLTRHQAETTLHFGEKEFDFIEHPTGEWVRESALRQLMEHHQALAASGPASLAEIRASLEGLLAVVDCNPNQETDRTTAINTARAVLVRLPSRME